MLLQSRGRSVSVAARRASWKTLWPGSILLKNSRGNSRIPTEVTASLNKIYVNRAIALLMSAQAEKPKSSQRLATLEQALLDLNRILRIQPRDEQGTLSEGSSRLSRGELQVRGDGFQRRFAHSGG